MSLCSDGDDDSRDVGFIVLTSRGRVWTLRHLHHATSEETKLELAWSGLYSTRGTRAQTSSRHMDSAELKCFGCGWTLPGGEMGKTDGAWERHRAAVGRACKYAAARPAAQPLAQYARQRDTLALQQLLLTLGKQLQAAEKAQDMASLEKVKKKVQFVVAINKEHIEAVPELKQGFAVLAKHLVGSACPRSYSSPSVSAATSSTSPTSTSTSPSPSSSSMLSAATQTYLATADYNYSPSHSASSSSSSSSPSPSSLRSSPSVSPPSSNPSSWSTSSIPVTSSDFYSATDSSGSHSTQHWDNDDSLKKQLMEYSCDIAAVETETETETETELESDADTCTDSGSDDSFAAESGDGDDSLRRGRPRYKEIDYHELAFLEKIGSGAFGTVWRGEWRGGQVAIKILHDSDVFNRQVLHEFRREAETMHVVGNHPCVVKFIGVCTKQGHFCIVSEFCAKGSLERLVRGNNRASLPLRTIVQMARDAAAGILHLHCESVIHRDIAARNIMIGDNYSAHVGDFGFARVKDKNASSAFTSTIGPAKYMAPEAIKEKKYSEKSDAFSFGVLLWEMVTGKEPWEDQKSLVEIAIGVSSRGWRLPIPDNCPPQLADLMHRCWATDPKERPDFRAIHRTLNNFLLALPAPSSPSSSPSSSP